MKQTINIRFEIRADADKEILFNALHDLVSNKIVEEWEEEVDNFTSDEE